MEGFLTWRDWAGLEAAPPNKEENEEKKPPLMVLWLEEDRVCG